MSAGTRFTYDGWGVLDEVVVSDPTSIHMEAMAVNQFWIGIERQDGPDIRIVLTSSGPINATVEED